MAEARVSAGPGLRWGSAARRLTADNPVNGQGKVGESPGRDGVAGRKVAYNGICAVGRFGGGRNAPVIAADQPDFGDAGAGIGGQFGALVVGGGGIGYFSQEKHVRRSGFAGLVEVGAEPQEHKVGLKFAPVVQPQRALGLHYRALG